MTVIALAAAAVASLMVLTWIVSIRLHDVSIVDVAWGLGFVAVAWVAAAAGDGDGARRLLLAALTTVWGARLAFYILRRKLREPGEDRRYGALRERHGHRFWLASLYVVFGFQALLVLIVSLPITTAATSTDELTAAAHAGVGLWAFGLLFESIGDAQLARFKRAHPGQVMDRGLWRYTRHPNYFGDACVWWGLWLTSGVWWTAVGPLVMAVLLVRVSGKRLLERDLTRRPAYAAYVRRTPGFVPGRPRRPSERSPRDPPH